jgi:hypothetical protein
LRNLLEWRAYIQPKVAQRRPPAKTIPHAMEMAKKFGLEILPPSGA